MHSKKMHFCDLADSVLAEIICLLCTTCAVISALLLRSTSFFPSPGSVIQSMRQHLNRETLCSPKLFFARSSRFFWMLFQAQPGTGLDFRSPKCERRGLDSDGKSEKQELKRHSKAKQTQISGVYLKISLSYINISAIGY